MIVLREDGFSDDDKALGMDYKSLLVEARLDVNGSMRLSD